MEENKEIMTVENEYTEVPEVETQEKHGMGTGAAMLLGGLLTAGGIAAFRKLKERKAKKETTKSRFRLKHKDDEDSNLVEVDFEDCDDPEETDE